MAIFIPGWADSLIQSGDVRRLGSMAGQAIMPDRFANQRLQQLIEQNPMLLSQIENMTPEARRGMEQTLGFKKQTPLQALPIGAELKQRMDDEQALATLTPEQRAIRVATRLGTKTTEAITREKQKFDQDLKSGQLQIDILTGQAADINRIQNDINESAKQYPELKGINIGEVAKKAVKGEQLDSVLMTRILSNAGAKALYEAAYNTELAKLKASLERRASGGGRAAQLALLPVLAEVGNQLNDQEQRLLADRDAAIKRYQEQNPYGQFQPGSSYAEDLARIQSSYDARISDVRRKAIDNTNTTIELQNTILGRPAAPRGEVVVPPPPPAGVPTPNPPSGLNTSPLSGFNTTRPPEASGVVIPQAGQAPPNETPAQRAARLRRIAGGG